METHLNPQKTVGILFIIYRRLGNVLWNRSGGGEIRVKKWLMTHCCD